MSSDLFKSLWRQNICTEFTEIGGSGYENKNQAINGWWAWQLLLLMINPKIICCKKRANERIFCFIKKNRCLSRSAADIVSLVARRSEIIHWHDEVYGVACRLACELICEAAHELGGFGIILPKRSTFQGKFRFSQSQWSGDFWRIIVWRETDGNLQYMRRRVIDSEMCGPAGPGPEAVWLQNCNFAKFKLGCGCDSWREVPEALQEEWERKASKSGRRTCQFVA